jgi:multisubunit Na+/H+ antiporter MnhF subunit
LDAVNEFLMAAAALMFGLGPCALACFRLPPADRLVALELGGTLDAMILLLIAQGLGYDPFFDLAVAVAFLTLAGGLVFAHFMERWV